MTLSAGADLRARLLDIISDKVNLNALAAEYGVTPATLRAWIINAEQPPAWVRAPDMGVLRRYPFRTLSF